MTHLSFPLPPLISVMMAGLRALTEERRRDPRAEAVMAGDRQAADRLLRGLLPRVRNLVRYLVRGDSEVDDITQHALLTLLKGMGTWRGDCPLEHWADRVTVRATFEYLRKMRSGRTRTDQIALDLRTISSPTPPTDEYLHRRQAVRLLDTLPDKQRVAVVLHHAVGMSVAEVAARLGVSNDTVKSRIRLGMTKLRAAEERRHAREGDAHAA